MRWTVSALLFCFFGWFSAHASDFENGVKSAAAENWQQAEQSFRNCIRSNPFDANAYYNLGTSLAAQHQEAEAVWALEKSLKYNPALKEARNNLQYCYSKLAIQETWEPALPYFQDKAYQAGIDTWTWLSVGLGIIVAGLLFTFIVARRARIRKVTLIFAILSAACLIFTLRNALISYAFRYNHTHAVMIQGQSSVFNDSKGNMRFDLELKSGTRYKISEFANGRIGLLMKNQTVVWIDPAAVKLL